MVFLQVRAFGLLVFFSFAAVVLSAPQATDGASLVDAADTVAYNHVEANESLVGAFGRGRPKRPCKRLSVRREWRDLSNHHKRSYISAVKCLLTAQTHNRTLPERFNRNDEFVLSHVMVADYIHGVGQFLPWHRHFGFLYEKALREECGYRGPFPYWDWTRDTADPDKHISESPLFDPVLGFGGNGVPGTYTPPTENDGARIPISPPAFTGCVQTGPFAGIVFHVGPNVRFSDHCLTRNFAEEGRREHLTPESIANISSQTTYDDFWNSLDGRPAKPYWRLHDAGHAMIGGDMSNFYSSPNDPIFYLHHAGLDRLWWKWQNVHLPSRLCQMGGQASVSPPHGETTLDYDMSFADLAPTVRVGETMDLRMEPYCYTYAD
ncbi:tyrosinase central domain-containing protein [Coprinopsis cinerea AmutBmut pab1-1]|nr:tyrosinase central domain-containing protein [Coprinopsis cinerea AmutBmut pab1-1]